MLDGYYTSRGEEHEDWHAGIHMKYRIFNAILFTRINLVKKASARTKLSCKNYNFKAEGFEESRSYRFYNIESCKIDIYKENNLIYQQFEIIDSQTIVDEYGIIYTYQSFVNEEEE